MYIELQVNKLFSKMSYSSSCVMTPDMCIRSRYLPLFAVINLIILLSLLTYKRSNIVMSQINTCSSCFHVVGFMVGMKPAYIFKTNTKQPLQRSIMYCNKL